MNFKRLKRRRRFVSRSKNRDVSYACDEVFFYPGVPVLFGIKGKNGRYNAHDIRCLRTLRTFTFSGYIGDGIGS